MLALCLNSSKIAILELSLRVKSLRISSRDRPEEVLSVLSEEFDFHPANRTIATESLPTPGSPGGSRCCHDSILLSFRC